MGAKANPRSEYDDAFGDEGRERAGVAGIDAVREAFRIASRPYLSSPVPWLVWSALLPLAAVVSLQLLATERDASGVAGPLLALWSVAIALGGTVEGLFLLRGRRRHGASRLGALAMTLQGNLSLVAVALSAAVVWVERAELLPALWLLLLGHSFFTLGGFAFPPLRSAGLLYQAGGIVALVPGVPPLVAFAVATALGNLTIAWGVVRARDRPS